jgi:hypothetical protein
MRIDLKEINSILIVYAWGRSILNSLLFVIPPATTLALLSL